MSFYYVLGEDGSLAGNLADAAALRAGGSVVIGLASVDQLSSQGMLAAAQQATDVLLDNAAPQPGGRFAAPMAGVLNAAAAWTVACELFAACTRLGHTPVVYKSLELDTRHRRLLRYGSQRFCHDQWVDPIAAGLLGKRYLPELGQVLLDVGTAVWTAIAAASYRADDALRAGERVYVHGGGRYVPYQLGGQLAGDPRVFRMVANREVGAADFVIAIGTHEPAGSQWWGRAQKWRDAGYGVGD
jgi:hypothetical protein